MAKDKKNYAMRELCVTFDVGGSASNEVTTLVPSSIAMEERKGMRLRCAEYYIGRMTGAYSDESLLTALAASLDSTRFGLCWLATQPTNGFKEESPGVIDFNRVRRQDHGTAGNSFIIVDPFVIKDFTKRDPDGVLVHPANLYVWGHTEVSMGAGFEMAVKIFYSIEDITDEQWEELWKRMFVTQAG